MPKRALTAAAVEKLKPPKSGQADHFDKGYPGLALRISYGGRKSWVYFYRANGKQRRLTLGIAPAMGLAEAREAWREVRKAVEAGQDPARMRAKPERVDTFEMIAAEWLQREQFGKARRSAGEVKRILERDVLPAWGQREIRDITRRDARELIDAIADRGAVTMARRVQAHLHALFRWSGGRDRGPIAERQGSARPGGDCIARWRRAGLHGGQRAAGRAYGSLRALCHAPHHPAHNQKLCSRHGRCGRAPAQPIPLPDGRAHAGR